MFKVCVISALAIPAILSILANASDLRADVSEQQASEIDSRSLSPDLHGSWLGWGANIHNNRWAAPDAVIDASNVAFFRPVCKKRYSFGESAPPLVVAGIAYYPTWDGLFVALDYSRCNILWQTNVTRLVLQYQPLHYSLTAATSRTTPAMYKNVLFIGSQASALLFAINKRNGKLIDTIQVSDHPLAIVTQSPTVWHGKIFVGSSSSEENGADVLPGYVCCSFIATMNGYIFKRGRFTQLWSQPMIPAGSNFTGAAIWGSQPSIDAKRKQVFIATGNVYTVPESYETCFNQTANATSANPGNATDPCAPKEVYQEAILAFDIATGDINWSHQLSPIDAWTVACLPTPLLPNTSRNPGACPDNPGRDADFGIAPTFVPGSNSTPSGKDTLIIGQKNGNIYALSASDGELIWATATSPDGTQGGLMWGLAVDDKTAYYTSVNSNRKLWKFQDGTSLSNSAFGAASLINGNILWETQAPRNTSSQVPPTIVNDVVMVGVTGIYKGGRVSIGPGSLLSLNKYTGTIINETILDSFFQGGIAVVRNYVMFGTGYVSAVSRNGTFNVWQLS